MKFSTGFPLIMAILLGAGIAPLRADDEAAIVRQVLENNRELRAARLTLAAAEARVKGAGRLSNPELEVEVAGGQDFEGRVEIGLSQRFPLTARLRLEKEISRLELEAARYEVAEKEREITGAARRAFLTLAGAKEKQSLRGRQAEVSETFSTSLQRRVTEGFASPLDANQASLEASELKAGAAEARADEIEAAGELAILLGTPKLPALTETLSLPKAIPASRSAASRPDVRLAEIAIEAAEKDIGLARAMQWEDIGIGLFVEGERLRDEPEGIDTEALIGMRLSVPLPVWNSGRAAVEEKKAVAQYRAELLNAVRLTAAQQADTAWQIMKARFTAAQQMQNDVLPMARKLLADTQAAYDRGESDVQSLFRARQRLIEIESAALEARREFHLARARWTNATDTTK